MHLSVATERDLRKSNHRQNLAEVEVIATIVSSEMSMVTNMKNWIVDSGATRYICGNKVHLLPTP